MQNVTVNELHDVAALPPDASMGDGPATPVPLADVLFDPGQDGQFSCYAVLDGAKIANLPEYLSMSGLSHCCLFSGQTAVDLADSAPWLVKLDANATFTRNLFTDDPDKDVPWYMWRRQPGLLLRSDQSMEDIRRTFRKLIRLRDSDNKWFYFRFWEGRILEDLMRWGTLDAAHVFTTPRDTLVLNEAPGSYAVLTASVLAARAAGPFVLSDGDKAVMRRLANIKFARKTSVWLDETYGAGPEDLAFLVQELEFAMRHFGTRNAVELAHYLAACRLIGARAHGHPSLRVEVPQGAGAYTAALHDAAVGRRVAL